LQQQQNAGYPELTDRYGAIAVELKEHFWWFVRLSIK
jgi:hypothetical protein